MYSALATYMYMHVYVKLDNESYTTAYTTIHIAQELYIQCGIHAHAHIH